MAKTVCKILGVVFILVGLVGFVSPGFLGTHLSTTHNLVHLISGAVALYFGGWVYAVLMAVIFGVLYREWEQMVTLKPLAPLGMVLIGLLCLGAVAFPMFGPIGTLSFVAVGVVASLFGGRPEMPWRIGGFDADPLTTRS